MKLLFILLPTHFRPDEMYFFLSFYSIVLINPMISHFAHFEDIYSILFLLDDIFNLNVDVFKKYLNCYLFQ